MALEDDIATLSQAPLLNCLTGMRFGSSRSRPKTGRSAPATCCSAKGDRSDGGYVVSRGAIALDANDDGSPATFIAGPGALIGQMALFTRIARPATATAREPSAVIRISPSLMRRVLEEFPGAASSMHDAMAEELSRLTTGLERVRRQLLAIDGDE